MQLPCRSLLLLWLGLCAPVEAVEIYQWSDDKGRLIFSDQPNDPAAEIRELTPHSNRYLFSVKRVSDGDTLILANNDRVRLLSVNAPEVSSRYREAEPGGNQAREWLQNELRQGQVYLQYDVEKRDHYGRLLAYAWSTSGTFLNKELLRTGRAVLTLQPPNLQYEVELINA